VVRVDVTESQLGFFFLDEHDRENEAISSQLGMREEAQANASVLKPAARISGSPRVER